MAAHLFWAYYHVVKRREGISLQAKKPATPRRKTNSRQKTTRTKSMPTQGAERTKKNG